MKDYNELNEIKENELNGQLASDTIMEITHLKDEGCKPEETEESANEGFDQMESKELKEENLELIKGQLGSRDAALPIDKIDVRAESLQDFSNEKVSEAENESIHSTISSRAKKHKEHNFKKYVAVALISSILSGSLVGSGLYYGFSKQLEKQSASIESLSTLSTVSNNAGTGAAVVTTADYSNDSTVTKIAKEVGASIVGIRMTVKTGQRSFYSSSGLSSGEGSGIIISKDGYIMTNYHVVQYADPKLSTGGNTTLEVFLSDGTQATAKFIGGDSETDLAVIKVELNNLPVAPLGDSSKLQVGELAVAIGNPLGLEFAGSVTTGVISALNRNIQSADSAQNLIQTDAAINPGNSGGALLNSKGEVIGINSAKISEEGVEGLGFAIPINDAKPIINQLMMFGYVKGRPFIGISGQDVTETISRAYNLPVGIYVVEVSDDSGAANAGIKAGDVLTSIDGKEVKTMEELNTIKKEYKPGDTVTVTVVRNGKTQSLKLTFTEQR